MSYKTNRESFGVESLDIAVLMGGSSPEREVSLASGICVAAALEAAGHQVAGFDPSEANLFSINWRQFDVCFVALHGGAGEGGGVQLQLEELAVPYTGSGPAASRLALSKSASKDRLRQYCVPTPNSVAINANDSETKILEQLSPLGYPVVIKPDSQGSSLGISAARNPAEVRLAVEQARQFESFLLAEPLISGSEFTVAVIDREPLPAIEIEHPGDLFDSETKYHPEAAEFLYPDPHSDSRASLAAETAVAATAALGTSGLVRVDMMFDRRNRPWVLEVNTVPGMTELSLAPRAAAATGLSMSQLCEDLIQLALYPIKTEVYA